MGVQQTRRTQDSGVTPRETLSSVSHVAVTQTPMQRGAHAQPVDVYPEVPAYLKETYTWAYLNPHTLTWLDRPWVVTAILFGNYQRLQRALLAEVEPGMRVLQAACVYGDLSENLARRLGVHGGLDVIDVAGLQVRNCKRKLKDFPHARTWVADAATLSGAVYDVVACFFLLHELPDDYKRQVVNALLGSTQPGGAVVFVDYHKPHFANPLKLPMGWVFDRLEPYARSLWHNEIATFANEPTEFVWRKQCYFGGLYQKVVARRRGTRDEGELRS